VAPEGEAAALAAWVRVLEDRVRRQPEQWFNFFDVWGGAPAR
jgi:predicted LPLAT superfamily acyltransferase